MKTTEVTNNWQTAIAHLSPENWNMANKLLLAKAIAEFSHEVLVVPEPVTQSGVPNEYRVVCPHDALEVYFTAYRHALDHWTIETASIQTFFHGSKTPADVVQFLIAFKDQLGFAPDNLGIYLEEILSCLQARAYTLAYNTTPVAKLVQWGYQQIEHEMSEGHPCFLANNARIGFDLKDYKKYAPEAAVPFPITWLAGKGSCTEFSSISPLTYQELLETELSPDEQDAFSQVLLHRDLDPSDYYYFPVHPWQWHNKLIHLFAMDIAEGRLVYLGTGRDNYLPQQSIRTLFNVSSPQKHYVKCALSILNMGFMRGLSPYFMRTTPAINEWVYQIVVNDPFLQRKGFTVLREIACIGYSHRSFEAAFVKSDAYNKMLSSLWRESPFKYVESHHQLMTMASLLHVDIYGDAFVAALIHSSGLTAEEWVSSYIDCYLSPLLHCYYHYDMRFMPHGENVILVLEHGIPVKTIMKDIGEEVAVINPDRPLPEAVERIRIPVPEELKILSLFTQAFDCYFRFLNGILVSKCGFTETMFWEIVAGCIIDYQETFPEHEEKFLKYDLFAAKIPKTCLNRLQIRNNKKMVDGSNPFKNQHFVGTLDNPVAKFSPIAKKTC